MALFVCVCVSEHMYITREEKEKTVIGSGHRPEKRHIIYVYIYVCVCV